MRQNMSKVFWSTKFLWYQIFSQKITFWWCVKFVNWITTSKSISRCNLTPEDQLNFIIIRFTSYIRVNWMLLMKILSLWADSLTKFMSIWGNSNHIVSRSKFYQVKTESTPNLHYQPFKKYLQWFLGEKPTIVIEYIPFS